MVYNLFTILKESRKNFYPRRDLNLGPRPQSKSDSLDRSAIGPATTTTTTTTTLKIIHLSNLTHTFYDLFCHIYMSPNFHMKLTSVFFNQRAPFKMKIHTLFLLIILAALLVLVSTGKTLDSL